MDYEKKYNDALERAREFQKSKDGLCVLTAESIFPELKESEDEKIRKTLIRVLNENVGNGIEKYGAKLEDALAWLEKQGEQKVPSVDFNAKDWYVSKVDGKIHDMTYNPADKVKPKFKVVEYVYILDYCSGRVMVVKHDAEESIETLFDKLGLKENQCHYMVSDNILSIEYINF